MKEIRKMNINVKMNEKEMEYMKYNDYLKKQREQLTDENRLDFVLNILNASKELANCVLSFHRARHLHLCINPDKILIAEGKDNLTNRHSVVISDVSVMYNIMNDFSVKSLVCDPVYSAPEVLEKKTERIGMRSDLYSIGAILYSSLLNRSYTSDDYAELPEQIRNSKILSCLTDELQLDILHIFRDTINEAPRYRYDNCEELIEALEKAIWDCKKAIQ